MTKISLMGGANPARSALASITRRLNVYSEAIDPKQGEPSQVIIYPTPGLVITKSTPNNQPIRGMYAASNGDLYCVVGAEVYYVDPTYTFNLIGTMQDIMPVKTTVQPPSITGTIRLTVDGTPNGTPITSTSEVVNSQVGYAVLVANGSAVSGVAWSLTGPDAPDFSIDATTGLLTTAVSIPDGTETFTINATVPDGTPVTTITSITTGSLSGITNPVKMADNGTSLIICDGIANNGYSVNMVTRSGLTPLLNPSASDALTSSSTGWLGSTYVDFSDGYLIANYIGTPTFYISNSEDVIFDPLQFAGKTSYPDVLIAAIVQHRVVWLIGRLFTEVWYNTGGTGGASNFPFELMPGVAIDWGCAAAYSIAKAETQIFWLGQNQNGEVVVLRGKGYEVSRVSTHSLEDEFRQYSRIDDCIAYCYMQNGHSFYVMNFPTDDRTWVFDLSNGQWHQRAWIDSNGQEHRHRSTMSAFAYGKNLVNDWENGNLYILDLDTYTDNGNQIKRVATFPRLTDNENLHRAIYREFTLEIDSGETQYQNDNPLIGLRWSEDLGHTWSNTIFMPIGKIGQFSKLVRWYRLGLGRRRIFELEWDANAKVAIQGAFIDLTEANT